MTPRRTSLKTIDGIVTRGLVTGYGQRTTIARSRSGLLLLTACDAPAPPPPFVPPSSAPAPTLAACADGFQISGGESVTGAHLTVAPAKGETAQLVTPDGGIDVGTTNRLAVNAWARVDW